MNVMNYRDYAARIEYSDEDGVEKFAFSFSHKNGVYYHAVFYSAKPVIQSRRSDSWIG